MPLFTAMGAAMRAPVARRTFAQVPGLVVQRTQLLTPAPGLSIRMMSSGADRTVVGSCKERIQAALSPQVIFMLIPRCPWRAELLQAIRPPPLTPASPHHAAVH